MNIFNKILNFAFFVLDCYVFYVCARPMYLDNPTIKDLSIPICLAALFLIVGRYNHLKFKKELNEKLDRLLEIKV